MRSAHGAHSPRSGAGLPTRPTTSPEAPAIPPTATSARRHRRRSLRGRFEPGDAAGRRRRRSSDRLRRLARQNPRLFPAGGASLDEVARCLAACRALRGNGSPPTMAAAIRAAIDVESAAAVPEVAQVLQALGEADRLHGAALIRFAAARGL